MRKCLNSAHKFVIRCLKNLKDKSCNFEKVVKRQTTQKILNNRLRIKALIDIVRHLKHVLLEGMINIQNKKIEEIS
jgi:hypothetical protein